MNQNDPAYSQAQQTQSSRPTSLASVKIYPSSPATHYHLYPPSLANCSQSASNLRKAAIAQQSSHHCKSPHVASGHESVPSPVYMINPSLHEGIPPVPPLRGYYAVQQPEGSSNAHHPSGNQPRLYQPYHPPMCTSQSFVNSPHAGSIYGPSTVANSCHPMYASSPMLQQRSSLSNHWLPSQDHPMQPVAFTPYQTPHHVKPHSTPRRIKKVPLYHGNLVLDCPVPTRLLDASPRKDKEFSMMRYSAVTCDPDEFATSGYTLRPQLMERETELFIVVTMYNEDKELFCRTMHGVMKNIAHLCSRSRSHMWNAEGWKKVVVCIVSDGRKKCDPGVLDVLTTLGVYQKGVAKNIVGDKPVKAHVYEYTTQISVDPDMKIKGADKGVVPAQILFCLKEQNAKKINSHRWFFNAFGPVLKPNICVLLDVGTRPGNTSIYHLWKTFDTNANIGGACGELCVMKGTGYVGLLNPLVAAQNFEYKMSNILDKPLESVFGYISVLPGAFSAYRYAALQNDAAGTGPLQKYFMGEKGDESGDSDILTANMYLAEDRILCFELLAKKHQRWVLRYVQSAFGETDCPDQLPEFLSQRRRWLNGSFFAAVYSICHFSRIWSTNHTIGRKLLLTIEFIFNFVSLIFNWLGMGNFFLTFYFIGKSLSSPDMDPFGDGWGNRVFQILRYLYIFMVIISFICSMGNRPQGSKWLFIAAVMLYSVIMGYTIFAGAWLTYKGVEQGMQTSDWIQGNVLHNFGILLTVPGFRNVVISMVSTYGLYIVSSLLYLDPWHMITSFVQYLLLLPTYVNILNVYAFCNTHDVSWGTKGDNTLPLDLGVASKAATNEKGEDAVEVELADEQGLMNLQYDAAIDRLQTKQDVVTQSRPPHTKQDDYYRGFRTRLVLVWIGCNAILVSFVTSGNFQSLLPSSSPEQTAEQHQNNIAIAYTGFILWMVAATSGFRFLGSVMYLVLRCFRV